MQGLSFETARGTVHAWQCDHMGHAYLRAYGVQQSINYRKMRHEMQHVETGEVCAVLEEEALDELRDQGDLDMSGLNSSEPGVLKELVRNLFLFCYARALRPSHDLNTKFEV